MDKEDVEQLLNRKYVTRNIKKQLLNFFDNNDVKIEDFSTELHPKIISILNNHPLEENKRKRKKPDGGFDNSDKPLTKKLKIEIKKIINEKIILEHIFFDEEYEDEDDEDDDEDDEDEDEDDEDDSEDETVFSHYFQSAILKKKREEFLKKQKELKKTEKKRSREIAKKQVIIKKQCTDLISQEDFDNKKWIRDDAKNFILKIGENEICHNIDVIKQVIGGNYFYECLKIYNNIRGAYDPKIDYNPDKKYFKLFPNNELVEYNENFFTKSLKKRHFILKKTDKKLKAIISSKLAPAVTESFVGKDHCQTGSKQIVYKIIEAPKRKILKKIVKKLKIKSKSIQNGGSGENNTNLITTCGLVLSMLFLI